MVLSPFRGILGGNLRISPAARHSFLAKYRHFIGVIFTSHLPSIGFVAVHCPKVLDRTAAARQLGRSLPTQIEIANLAVS
jgi:hypothetical protein